MADLRQGGPPAWLEAELSRQLCAVSAPDSLWNRIHEQRRPLRARPNPWRTWSIAAAALLVLLAGLVWRLGATRGPAAELEALAQGELKGTSKVDFRSDDPRKIQAWVRANAGVDIQLPDRRELGNDVVSLIGVRLLRTRNAPVAVISYQAGETSAALLVTNGHADSGGTVRPGHALFHHETFHDEAVTGARLYSWSAGASEYALAFASAKDAGRPCLLCHAAATPALMILR